MIITMEDFPVEKAFDVTLLHNIRWALLNWLEKVKFNRDPKDIVNPHLPQELIGIDKQIEPIPGSGVLVFNSSKKVLLTLILKRGMLRWELPAGVSKTDETLEETAKRETLEETGMNIEIGDVIASCWHFSRELNKGWMGLFFKGKIIRENELNLDQITIATPQAFSQNGFNIVDNPGLYRQDSLQNFNYDELLRLCNTDSSSTVHESVVASGFVEWKKIPESRIHPLHRKLLEFYERDDSTMQFLYADADADREEYNNESKLYSKN